MRLLVTGGAGFIGSNFVRRALNGSYDGIQTVTVLDSLTYAGNLENLREVENNIDFNFIHGSITDQEILSEILPSIDCVINFAAESHVDRSIASAGSFVDTNIKGVQILLESVRKYPSVRFVQISTDEVYGSILEGSWDEDEPLLPNSPYAASKASGELLVRSFHRTYGMDTVVTRCSNNYGHFHHPEKLIPLFITNLLRGKKVPLYGNGLNVRDWLHVDDHCDGIYLATTLGKSGEIYNFGGGRELTNLEITSRILEAFSLDSSVVEHVPDRLGHDLRYSVKWEKARRELGYLPKVNFEDGLKATIAWYIDNRAWWEKLVK